MKKVIYVVLGLALLGVITTSCEDGIFDRSVSDVPTEIESYVVQHFPNDEIRKVEVDRELSGINSYYEVYLDNGTIIDFTKEYEAVEIEGESSGVPITTLPQSTQEYLNENHGERVVVAWEKYPNKYEVYLDTELEVFFDSNGNFDRYDD